MTKRDPKGLDGDGLRILYGVHPIREAFRAGRRVVELVVRRGNRKLAKEVESRGRAEAMREATNHELSQLAGAPGHQGVVARVEALANASLNHLVRTRGEDLLCLMVDGVQDPQNLGTLFRVADGAGVDLVVVSARGSASVQLGSVAKASAGAIEHQALLVVGDLRSCLQEMHEHGFTSLCLEAGEGEALYRARLSYPLCLVVGSEGKGVAGRLRDACTGAAHLPLRGKVNSLNVAVAGALAVFHAAEQRPRGEPGT